MAKYYIELEAAISKLRLVEVREVQKNFPAAMLAELKTIPAADVKPVVRGKWMPGSSDASYCSACCEPQETKFYMPNYCPNCGADMRETKT